MLYNCFKLILTFSVFVRALPADNRDEPLLLSPLIALGKIKEAQEMALVGSLVDKFLSYSGFLTVNKTCNSNMFFWFFPSGNNANSDPVAVWLNGGPGSSSLLSLLTENGPYRLTTDGELVDNKFSWNRNSSILYVDNPVGAGFSFTGSLDCYCRNEVEVASNFLALLEEFFRLFPNLRNNKFFLSGESYAGKYIPAIAYAIFNRKTSIHLEGIAIGNGLIDPINQLHYAEHFYQLGLADESIKKEMEKAEEDVRVLIKMRRFSDAATRRVALIKVIFGEHAGYKDFYNYLHPDGIRKGSIRKFVNKQSVRTAIHVGQVPFSNSTLVSNYLHQDIMQSVRPWLEFLLDKCRVCLYYGQMDLRDSYVASRDFISDLKWSGRASFQKAKRKVWRVGDELAGYVRSYGNLIEVMVRNAGHFVPMDQPKWALDMFNRFIFNQTF
ncbi:hypothetical protein RUM43_014118 [Polyplax serrata]|uniref:Carboxypeptidase n=1 Tax=Polyplax serrata TaxID=468196 RepID=A0AAN8NJ34_POLSC